MRPKCIISLLCNQTIPTIFTYDVGFLTCRKISGFSWSVIKAKYLNKEASTFLPHYNLEYIVTTAGELYQQCPEGKCPSGIQLSYHYYELVPQSYVPPKFRSMTSIFRQFPLISLYRLHLAMRYAFCTHKIYQQRRTKRINKKLNILIISIYTYLYSNVPVRLKWVVVTYDN